MNARPSPTCTSRASRPHLGPRPRHAQAGVGVNRAHSYASALPPHSQERDRRSSSRRRTRRVAVTALPSLEEALASLRRKTSASAPTDPSGEPRSTASTTEAVDSPLGSLLRGFLQRVLGVQTGRASDQPSERQNGRLPAAADQPEATSTPKDEDAPSSRDAITESSATVQRDASASTGVSDDSTIGAASTRAPSSDEVGRNGAGAAEATSPGLDEQSNGDEARAAEDGEIRVTAAVHSSISQIGKEEWNRCACSGPERNPFVSWEFLAALEDSGSAVRSQGWLPQHIALRNSEGELLGVAPMYLKSHSYGEYVFDHSWAGLHQQLQQPYYPKLQCCVPFTPVTGPRVLLAPTESDADARVARRTIMAALIQVADAMEVSSVHMTFNTASEWQEMGDQGWLKRIGLQYHWDNVGLDGAKYTSFDAYLADLKQSKRKNVRQERKSIAKQGLVVERLRGAAITPEIWNAFYGFYLDTIDRKWGSAYLTRDFFMQLGATMGDSVLLVVARDTNRGGELVAAALNLIGSHAIFGRNWGCKYADSYKCLHFELCYYQAIEAAIEMGLSRVEAGAQGEHKLQRGYLPNITYSTHYVRNVVARAAIQSFLRREAAQMTYTIEALTVMESPFKQRTAASDLAFADAKATSEQQQEGATSDDDGVGGAVVPDDEYREYDESESTDSSMDSGTESSVDSCDPAPTSPSTLAER